MTMAAAIASSTAIAGRRATGPGLTVTESSRPNATRRTWLGEKGAGDGEITGSRPPILPRGLGPAGPGTRAAGSTGT
jgi:hypothetical protein